MLRQSSNIASGTEPGTGATPEAGYVIGVDIGGTNLRLALADKAGDVLGKWTISIAGVNDVKKVLDLIREGAQRLLEQSSVPLGLLRSIAVGVPGVTNADEGVVIATSYLLGWRNVPMRDLLESAIGVPSVIDNDVNMAAVAEGQFGAARGIRDFVFIAIGTGIGAGVVLNGQLFHGMGWTAGEIGYMLVPGTATEPVERGKPGALEGLVGGAGIKERWNNLWSADQTAHPLDLTATEIFDCALTGDPLAQAILETTAETLAYAIYNISLIMNCPLFVLGGTVGIHPALTDATRSVLQLRGERAQITLCQSALGTDAQLIGAIRLALSIVPSTP